MAESVPIKDANAAVVAVATDTVVIGGETVIAQRIKAGFGGNGIYKDIDEANPLPTTSKAIDEEVGKMVAGNVREKWKCGFSTLAEFLDSFTEVAKDANDLVFSDGNVAGASYIDICKSALVADTSTVYLARKAFKVPYQLETGFGLSQRIGGQEFYLDMVGVNADADGVVQSMISTLTPPADLDISGGIVIATNTWIVTTTQKVRGVLRPGDYISIYGCQDTRLNVSNVVITALVSVSDYGFTFSLSGMSDNTYSATTGGHVRYICPAGQADYLHGLRLYGISASNADTVRRNGAADPTGGNGNRASLFAWNPGNTQTDSAIANEGGINYAGINYVSPFKSKGLWRTEHTTGFLQWITKDQDSQTNVRSTQYRESEIPSQDKWYAMRLRAINLPNLGIPAGSSLAITAVSKAGSTTATVTCPGHGLNINSRIRIYGILDQTNFANAVADVAPASIIDANQFTVVFGASATASSYGGVIVVSQNGQVPSIQSSVAQTYGRTYDSLRLTLVNSGAQSEVIGNIVTLVGCVTVGGVVQSALHGRYRIARISGSSTELEPMDGAAQIAAVAAAPASQTACTGVLIRNSSFRIHYAKVIDYVRMLTEPANANGNSARSAPVNVNNTVTAVPALGGATWANVTPATSRSAAVHFGAPASNADVASAARTTNGNSGTIADDFAGTVAALINVTAISGTSPTLDLIIKESFDNGTTWQDTYHVERITGTGAKRLPPIPISGRRRWDWVLGGTSPSFTFTITTMRGSQAVPVIKRLFDRTANVLNGTLSTATAALDIAGCHTVEACVSLAAATTPGTYRLQLSDDGTLWYNAGTATVGVANDQVRFSVGDTCASFARVICSGAATTQTGNYVSITARGS